MSAFSLSRRAKTDLKAIAKYTEARWGRQQRDQYIKQFDDAFHMLAQTPSTGKDCDYIREGYRKFPQGTHIIFYKSGKSSAIEIIRILHKRMDVEAKFEG